jgi:hypothetical protein
MVRRSGGDVRTGCLYQVWHLRKRGYKSDRAHTKHLREIWESNFLHYKQVYQYFQIRLQESIFHCQFGQILVLGNA